MKCLKTEIDGLRLLEPEPHSDHRGLFVRTFCEKLFRQWELHTHFPQCSSSFNAKAGTVRGMHLQIAPHEEIKVVRCTQGRIFDVIVDFRPKSSTYLKWQAFELSAENRRALYVPPGCAHGFQSLEDSSEVYYMISTDFSQDSARGLRWNDPRLGIPWPLERIVISSRDEQWPLLP